MFHVGQTCPNRLNPVKAAADRHTVDLEHRLSIVRQEINFASLKKMKEG